MNLPRLRRGGRAGRNRTEKLARIADVLAALDAVKDAHLRRPVPA